MFIFRVEKQQTEENRPSNAPAPETESRHYPANSPVGYRIGGLQRFGSWTCGVGPFRRHRPEVPFGRPQHFQVHLRGSTADLVALEQVRSWAFDSLACRISHHTLRTMLFNNFINLLYLSFDAFHKSIVLIKHFTFYSLVLIMSSGMSKFRERSLTGTIFSGLEFPLTCF